jgi:IS5 family transposase
VQGRKRHLLTDTLGLVWGRLVTPANVQDKTGARRLLGPLLPVLPRLRRLWADGAYDSAPLAQEVAAHGCTLEITRPRARGASRSRPSAGRPSGPSPGSPTSAACASITNTCPPSWKPSSTSP